MQSNQVVARDSSCDSCFQLLSAGQGTKAAADSKEPSHLCPISAYQHRIPSRREMNQVREVKLSTGWWGMRKPARLGLAQRKQGSGGHLGEQGGGQVGGPAEMGQVKAKMGYRVRSRSQRRPDPAR